jgi:GNAT superfamily N-acetyltransferase
MDAYWALGRSLETVTASVANSECYGVYAPDGSQVGIARVVTDGATFAWLCDVYIDRGSRGLGLGTWLATSIAADVQARGVRRLVLATADAHEVYRKAGFTELVKPERWMEIDRRQDAAPSGDVADS